MMPRGISPKNPPKRKLQGGLCRCHPPCQGHHYDDTLRCQNGDCYTTWEEQQVNPTPCKGLWVQRQGREVGPE